METNTEEEKLKFYASFSFNSIESKKNFDNFWKSFLPAKDIVVEQDTQTNFRAEFYCTKDQFVKLITLPSFRSGEGASVFN